jgi:ribosomal protein L7Ae-like RNA K-turn-binding protein
MIDPADERAILQLVGLARRAGRAVAGTQAVREAGSRGELNLVLVAGDAADNARRRVAGILENREVAMVRCGTRETLGRAVGKPGAAVVGVRDPGLAERILASDVGRNRGESSRRREQSATEEG